MSAGKYTCVVLGVGDVPAAARTLLLTGSAIDVLAAQSVGSVAAVARDLMHIPRAWAFAVPLAGPPGQGDWLAAAHAFTAAHAARHIDEPEDYARDGVYAFTFGIIEIRGLLIPGVAQ